VRLTGAAALLEKNSTVAKLLGTSTDARRPMHPIEAAAAPRLLLIGASTGGPKAIADLLQPLPRDWPVAVVVVQHVDVAFSQGLATWLGERTGQAVRVAEHGERFCMPAQLDRRHVQPFFFPGPAPARGSSARGRVPM
jgi:two-component system response regulator WspF